MEKMIELGDFHINFNFMSTPLDFESFRLYQVGKKFCNAETVIDTHYHHGWLEIMAFVEGKAEVYINNQSVSVGRGDLTLSFPGEFHKIISDAKTPTKYLYLSFSDTKNSYQREFEQIKARFNATDKRIFQNPTIVSLMESLLGEMATNTFEKEKIVSLILQQILILVVRDFLYDQTKLASNYAKADDMLCYKIMKHIERNVFSLQNLFEIAEHFGYNYSYLSKVFKRTTNNTIAQYLSTCKLERAKSLIQEGKLTFTKIADLLNYASIYSFSKSFKLHFGISPSEYKKSLRN